MSALQQVTRKINPAVERELWVRAGGRCQFPSCNRLLYRSPVTQERVNIAQKAHIYSFSPDGPRGRGPYAKDPNGLNDTKNLLLVCHDCHQTIDQDKRGGKYSAKLLQKWKQEHEARIVRVTGICPEHKSHMLLYGSRIGEEDSPLQAEDAIEAMIPDWWPVNETPINLSMKCEHEDKTATFWKTEAVNLRSSFERWVTPLIKESRATHFSVFGFADMPLLMLLGSLFTDKRLVETYQLHREPRTWRWQTDAPDDFMFLLKRPRKVRGVPVLVFSLSASIDPRRVRAVLGRKVAIWELTVAKPHNDFLRSRAQLAQFRTAVRKAMVEINQAHHGKPLHIFPAMPVACAIELGRVRMPKADAPWILYDGNGKLKKFIKALTIGEHHEPA